jgi:hypothetical protein
MATLSTLFSGIVLNQNASDSLSALSVDSTAVYYQQFRLPPDYKRETVTPALTGVQVFCGITALDAAIAITLEQQPFLGGWTQVASGTASAAPLVDDEAWLTCYFDEPVDVRDAEDSLYRIKLSVPTHVKWLWRSAPNPLRFQGGSMATDADGHPLTEGGTQYSFNFRLLGAVADSGIDFLGNIYRSAALRQSTDNARLSADADTYWMSGPQPSKFAVVSQYFELQDVSDNAVVIDRMYLDPVTPGMWCHVYYSNDGEPGKTSEEWEERLWTPVPRPYHALRAGTFVFPDPIRARFVKVEYSHLQAKSYTVGAFQKPITYKKHPKWVLDYFLLATQDAQSASSRFVANNVHVRYNAYDLAYQYYSDDLTSSPDAPPSLSQDDVQQFLAQDAYAEVDAATRAQISTTLNPFLSDTRTAGLARTLLGQSVMYNTSRYPVEALPGSTVRGSVVSSLNREAVVFEDSWPVMHFYLTARHRYKEVEATLPNDRAYFAGVRQIAFTREQYAVESDLNMYVETLGDFANAERNDFLPEMALPADYIPKVSPRILTPLTPYVGVTSDDGVTTMYRSDGSDSSYINAGREPFAPIREDGLYKLRNNSVPGSYSDIVLTSDTAMYTNFESTLGVYVDPLSGTDSNTFGIAAKVELDANGAPVRWLSATCYRTYVSIGVYDRTDPSYEVTYGWTWNGAMLQYMETWIRMSQVGNTITVSLFATDPGAAVAPSPIGSGTFTLTGTNAARFGAGVSGRVGISPWVTSSAPSGVLSMTTTAL